MSLRAGSLNHRVELHEFVSTKNETTGVVTEDWELFAELWANVRPASVREFIQGGAQASKAAVSVKVRYLPGLKPSMRIRHGERLYQVEGVLPDPYSGKEWITLACSEVQQG